MKRLRLIDPLLCGVLIASGALAQSIPMSALAGKVVAGGLPLPGVTVTVTSPSLQGSRTTVTTGTGDYLIPFLPPGQYTVTFEMDKMQPVRRTLTLTAGRTDRLDAELALAVFSEEIAVTAEKPSTTAIEVTEVSTNFEQDLVDVLPVGRTLEAVTLLAPGVVARGPNQSIMISGAMSYDSLYLVNGAIVNENLRGQPHSLFIEDAIQETTVLTAGISAEFGHFTGGVVNMLTRSGGNQLEGSARVTLDNESWRSRTPFTAEQEDTINPTYEATLGGPIYRDKVWFFAAGRYAETSDVGQTQPGLARTGDQDAAGNQVPVGTPLGPITYPHGERETRLEGKLTGAIATNHRLIASTIDIDRSAQNTHYGRIMDLRSLVPDRTYPNTLLALNYSGVLSRSFFLEAQYSAKEYTFLGGGSRWVDDPAEGQYKGTLILDRMRGTRRFWSPTFRYQEGGEQRDHELYTLKGTYFLSTESFGTHELKLGYEHFMELRHVNNYQNGSDYRVSLFSTIVRGNTVYPWVRTGGSYTRILWYPILAPSRGSGYASDSLYLNDRWVAGDRWTFNLGVRYDRNDAISGDHAFKVADDQAISPRLGASFDVLGDGRMMLTASYGQYVGRLAEGVGNDGDPAGQPATFQWNYRGPAVNADLDTPTDQLVGTEEALRIIFEWFFANGGVDMRPFRRPPWVPGVQRILDPNGLKSPNVKEWTIGIGAALGTRGHLRADLVRRSWDDFYASYVNLGTGKVTDDYGTTYDQAIVGNDSSVYDRTYSGIQAQGRYRVSERLNVGGTYTWSRLVGNINGEPLTGGPASGAATLYPEYREERWNYPTGYLFGDRRHRAKLWATYDQPTPIGDFTFSLLQSFESGTASSTDGTIDPRPYVDNPGYVTPPSEIGYFFGGRGNIKTDDITRTDLSVNYQLALGPVQLFLQAELFNVFNRQAVVSFNEDILTNKDEDWLAPFDPFTDTPVECPQGASPATCQEMGANWQKGESFGLPTGEGDFQTPRTFRLSLGLRF